MDIDSITASGGFTFAAYRALCVKNKICQRCQKAYDEAHISNRSCPNTEVAMKDKLDLFLQLAQHQHPTTHLTQIHLGPLNPEPAPASWDHIGPGLFADMLMYGCDADGNPIDGKSLFSVSPSPTLLPPSPASPPTPSRLVLPIHLLHPEALMGHQLPPGMSLNAGPVK
ncbi:hypothetical protein PGT21_018448 [Puccinia graminis f. sp. tritici]|uniref:Uncharacterized protein n=1 Tax=Puccinia graminis f. sp. tritici TaxID=56615 RepID=A0A5B0QIK0_PUCGR|nr:hypothetical protein PGT21_018448 [Puccinia graminis f. sp. tritici]